MDEAVKIGNDIGVKVRFGAPCIPQDCINEWQSTLPEYSIQNKIDTPNIIHNGDTMIESSECVKSLCVWPWTGVTVQANGNVSLCCIQYEDSYDIGNVIDDDLLHLWNSEINMLARMCNKGLGILSSKVKCMTCDMMNSSSVNPPDHIQFVDVIENGGIPYDIIVKFLELNHIVSSGYRDDKLFEELYQYTLI
jgi:radical SAM protein with 4Fe4S-binding SPASM domain